MDPARARGTAALRCSTAVGEGLVSSGAQAVIMPVTDSSHNESTNRPGEDAAEGGLSARVHVIDMLSRERGPAMATGPASDQALFSRGVLRRRCLACGTIVGLACSRTTSPEMTTRATSSRPGTSTSSQTRSSGSLSSTGRSSDCRQHRRGPNARGVLLALVEGHLRGSLDQHLCSAGVPSGEGSDRLGEQVLRPGDLGR
jgi:hypothetical protein